MLLDYTHAELNCEISAIGGYYLFLKEAALSYKGKSFRPKKWCIRLNSRHRRNHKVPIT